MSLETRLDRLEAQHGAGDIFVTYDGEVFSRCFDGATFSAADIDGVSGARIIHVKYTDMTIALFPERTNGNV